MLPTDNQRSTEFPVDYFSAIGSSQTALVSHQSVRKVIDSEAFYIGMSRSHRTYSTPHWPGPTILTVAADGVAPAAAATIRVTACSTSPEWQCRWRHRRDSEQPTVGLNEVDWTYAASGAAEFVLAARILVW